MQIPRAHHRPSCFGVQGYVVVTSCPDDSDAPRLARTSDFGEQLAVKVL